MEKVSIDEVDTQLSPLGVHSVRKPVSTALGTDHFAMNYFELEPEESFSGGLHTHHDQEEVFYVVEGEVEFEVLASQRDAERPSDPQDFSERDTVTVGAGELVRFAPGEWQTGWNRGDERVVGWALGAPGAQHDWDELESVVDCRDCGEETPHATTLDDEGRFQFTCNECGASFSV